jgi:hypothetical protein
VWNRESEADKQEYKKKKKNKNQYECDLYYKCVKEGDKHASDLKYLEVMFFIAGTGLGMTPHLRDGNYSTPIHQYHLFNILGRHAICAGEVEY